MKVIPPLTVTDAMLTSSTAAEPGAGEVAWNAGTAYALGAKVFRSTTHRLYERLVAGTTAALPEADAVNWLDIGPTNKWAMFDLLRNTATEAASPLTVVLTPGKRIDALALMSLQADTVTVTMTVGAVQVYSATRNQLDRNTQTWSQYFFGAFTYQETVVLFDLPAYATAVLTVTITRGTGTVKCGALCMGQAVFLGNAKYPARSDALNFSRIDRDAFGNATLTPRRSVPKTEQVLWLEKALLNRADAVRKALNAVPAVWSGLDDNVADGYFEALLILGVYKEFSFDLAYPLEAMVNLTLEEI